MDIPAARWYPAIAVRHSRRIFDSSPLEASVVSHLGEVCRSFRPFDGVRAELVLESPDKIFKGAVGPYGKVKGAPALIAFVGDATDPHVNEKLGYVGEGIVLEATAMDLGTCWVGGFFRKSVAAKVLRIGRQEQVFAVTPVGRAVDGATLEERTMKAFARSHQRRSLDELVDRSALEQAPVWVKSALEAARVAPSAVNRQPWRFRLEPDRITVSVDRPRFELGISKRLDCGIAMLHIEVAARAEGVRGTWEFLQSPGVASFMAAGGTAVE
jgi:hypothetical protein